MDSSKSAQDESFNTKTRKPNNWAAVVAAINAQVEENRKIQETLKDLNAKFDKIAEQLHVHKTEVREASNNSAPAEKEKKTENAGQQKPKEVIYVRKASEFSFYN